MSTVLSPVNKMLRNTDRIAAIKANRSFEGILRHTSRIKSVITKKYKSNQS